MAVLAHEHKAKTENGLALTLGRDSAATDLVPLSHGRDVADINRRAVFSADDDVGDLVGCRRECHAMDER